MYREMPTRALDGSVVHGPFPIRWAALVFMVGSLLLGLVTGFYTLGSDTLVCAADGRCELTTRRPPLATTTVVLERGELTGEGNLRSERVTGSKGHVTGRVVLHSDRGPERWLLPTSVEKADRVVNEANAALAAGRPMEFTLRNDPIAGVFAVVLFAVFFLAGRAHFANAGRFRVTVVRGGVALRVTRAVFGVPIASRDVSLEGVVDVRVDTTTIDDFWTPKGMRTFMARLVLVDGEGEERPLTRTFHTGKTLHYRAAAELRAILGLEPQPGGAEETLAKMPLVITPMGSRVGFGWLGMCCGFLLGPLVSLSFGLATGLMERRPGGDIDTAWFLSGGALGACAGIAIALYATRPRLPA